MRSGIKFTFVVGYCTLNKEIYYEENFKYFGC